MQMLFQGQTAEPIVFFMASSSDGKTGVTGLTPTVTLSKNGGAFASAAGAVAEIAHGWYQLAGNATDQGTLGPLILHATGSDADPADVRAQVVSLDLRTDTAQTGNVYTLVDTEVAAIYTRIGAPAGASIAADLATIATYIDAEVAAIKAKTDNLPVDPADASDIVAAFSALTTLLSSTGIALTSAERTALAGVVLTTAGTESYRADGAAPTLMQALCELLAHMGEVSISGTTKTIKRFDGVTTAASFTTNDATSPTSITRAS